MLRIDRQILSEGEDRYALKGGCGVNPSIYHHGARGGIRGWPVHWPEMLGLRS